MGLNHGRAVLQTAALPLSYFGELERVRRIELLHQPWQGRALPLSYTRMTVVGKAGLEPAKR